MRHRVFIAVNLPEDVKRKLSDYQSKWQELPGKWTKKENLHLTLVFLGYLIDEEVAEVCKIAKGVAVKHSPFSITLNKVCYGPPGKMPPRMIWVQGEKSKELANLKDDLENSLMEDIRSALSVKGGGRDFSPHLTLARIRQWEFRRIEPEDRPEVDENISLSFNVNSIEVMESVLKKGGPEYIVLESAEFKS